MKEMLEKGDRVKLLSTPQLKELFENRGFFSSDFRQKAAETLGDKEGVVESIEEKYAFDYFFFLPDGQKQSWSIPYQAVKE
jgi:hypothetical protein